MNGQYVHHDGTHGILSIKIKKYTYINKKSDCLWLTCYFHFIFFPEDF